MILPSMIRPTIVPVWARLPTNGISCIRLLAILPSPMKMWKRDEISWYPVHLCEVHAASIDSAKNFESSADMKNIINLHLLRKNSVLQNSHLPPSCITKTAQLRSHTQLHEALVQILCNTWGASRDNAHRGVQSLRGELSVVRWGRGVYFADVGWFWKSFGRP